jgi:ribonucleoside-diphosphate reductase alpha chain
MLIRLGVPYSSGEAVELGRKVMQFVDEESKVASEHIAAERGVFPEWERSIWGPDATCARDAQGQRIRPERRLRNCNVTTVAPTGTISMIAGCSSGIEPIFAVAFWRYQADARMLDINPDFVARAQREGWYSEELMARIADSGHIHHPEVPEAMQRAFVTAHDIVPEWHVRMQGAFQEYTDSAISKCIAAGTLLPTSRGLMRIEDFAETTEEDTFTPMADDIQVDGYQVLSHYRAGFKPATKITLDNGASLTGATESHRVMTSEGWKLMSELRVGDMVLGKFVESHGPGGAALPWNSVYRTNSNNLPIPERMTTVFATLLGMLVADGHTTESTGHVGITCKNEIVESEFVALCETIFGMRPKVVEDKRNEVRYIYLTSRNLARFVEGLIGKGAYHKVVPDAILRGSAEEKLAFLRGVTLDGYVIPFLGLCIYNGMSEQLAYQLAEVCRSFGMPRVYQGTKYIKETSAFSHMVLVSNEFQALIDCVETHKNVEPITVTYKVFVGKEVIDSTKVPVAHPNYAAIRALRQRGHVWCKNTTAEAFGWSTLTLAYRVTKVEEAELVDMYDIEVAESHAYVVNGMISHNTINFPNDATPEQVREAYELAYRLGCKGITVYRDGSRSNQVLSTGSTADPHAKPAEAAAAPAPAEPLTLAPQAVKPRQVPDGLPSHSYGVVTPLGKLRLFVTEYEQEPFEVFAIIGRAGSDVMAFTEAIGRLLSLALRCGIPVKLLAEQLRGIGGSRSAGFGPSRVRSVPDAIGKLLQDHYVNRHEGHTSGDSDANGYSNGHRNAGAEVQFSSYMAFEQHTEPLAVGEICPDCQNATLMNEEGCRKCHSCGYAEC